MTKLYLVHCGFYDTEVFEGIYESHGNFFVVAESFDDARVKAKLIPEYQKRKMHVDGLQEIQVVDGHRVVLQSVADLEGRTILVSNMRSG